MLRLAMRPAALQQRGRMALAPVSLLPCRGLAKKAKQAEPTPKPKLTADAPLKAKKTYRPTMLLPKTAFEIQAKAHERDHLWAQRTTVDLYRWQAQHNPGPRFVLADGPPYANGPLHMGHALNKILKDIINRFQVLQGRKVHYEPGWDCHGLPIEIKAKGHLATLKIEATPSQVRDKAREVAVSAMEQQQDEFSAFGIMADWSRETTYRTLDPAYEVRQLNVFGEMVRRGLVYRAYRPVYWSPSSRTALAEAELEYDLNHVSRSVFVRFNFVPGEAFREACADNVIVKRALSRDEQISLVIWTTTPWTLPSNMAVAVNRDITYRLVRVTEGPTAGELLIVAAERAHDLSQRKVGLSEFASADRAKLGEFETLAEFSGAALSGSSYRHLFLRRGAESRPILAADYVTDTSGTGLVHCAPAHGQEDYALYRNTPALAKEPLLSPVDAAGRYTEDVLQCGSVAENLPGNAVTGTGGSIVRDLLAESGALLSEWPITHSFPCDWRTKQPVITRATSQWFADLTPIKDAAIAALEKVEFTPPQGRNRLASLVAGRSEWCISRQRPWGVPIPVLYDAHSREPLLTPENVDHITAVLGDKGSDYWWQGDAEEFVAPAYRDDGRRWIKGTDTVDVWFDSGTSWTKLREEIGAERDAAGAPLADIYLEGTDQARGWFQSSLLTHIATAPEGTVPQAPYGKVITHGFVVDKRGKKMSKSIGNVLSPLYFVKGGATKSDPAYGADVLRLWAARGDYSASMPVGTLIVKHTSDAMRKLRNTARFMLATLPRPDQVAPLDDLATDELTHLDRYVLHKLRELELSVKHDYEVFDFAAVVRQLGEFANGTLSTIYFTAIKDVLYSDALSSPRRRACIAVLDQTLRTFTSMLAPITPHLAEEIHHYRSGTESDPQPNEPADSVFQQRWQGVNERWTDKQNASEVRDLLKLRDSLLALIERAREEKKVRVADESEVDIDVVDGRYPELVRLIKEYPAYDLTAVLGVSRVNVFSSPSGPRAGENPDPLKEAADLHDGIMLVVRATPLKQCPRCRVHIIEPELEVEECGRCEEALVEHKEMQRLKEEERDTKIKEKEEQ